MLLKNNILNLSIGVIYLWFGLLKFPLIMSPAETIVQKTSNRKQKEHSNVNSITFRALHLYQYKNHS